jgi:nucleoside-diphosphate-sugar epimerase
MKVLVTGAAGLIGAELCRQLHSQHHVIAVDNFSRGTTVPPCSHFYSKDLAQSLDFLAGELDDIHIIYHLAATNGTSNFYSQPNQVLANNTRIDLNVFEFAKQCKQLGRIFYASSSEVMAHENFCTESTRLIIDDVSNPRYSYKIAKISAENYLHNSELPWVILRYFNVYGADSKPGHFVYDQISNHTKKIFKIIGGEETRCYTHVEDAVDATICVATTCDVCSTINIGSSEELSSIDAVKIIAEELKCTTDHYEMIPGLPGSPRRRKPDISTLLTFYPTYSPMDFRTGIRKILNHEQP